MSSPEYEVKPLPYEYCTGCIFNGCYPWNRNPLLLCPHMGGIMIPIRVEYKSGMVECTEYEKVSEQMWQTHLGDLKKEAALNEECRRRAMDGKVLSSELLPAEYLESKRSKKE